MDIKILNRIFYKVGKYICKKEVSGSGLRQASRFRIFIRPDHRGRYKFASETLKKRFGTIPKVVDAACGTGYGSTYFNGVVKLYEGFDIDEVAIAEAKKLRENRNCRFSKVDLLEKGVLGEGLPAIVSFETLEHVPDALKLLNNFYDALEPNGFIIISVPNQEKLPYSIREFPHHFFHYKPAELRSTLEKAGFHNIDLYSQPDRLLERVENNSNGLYLIATAFRK